MIDDWDGFGQKLTASGTTRFHQVPVASEDITRHEGGTTTSETARYQLVHLATLAGIGQAAAEDVAQAELADTADQQAELVVAQAQTVVSTLIPEAVAVIFGAPGTSATANTQGLDRCWCNARTLVSHNPRVYKERIVGDDVVNVQTPSYQWRIGTATRDREAEFHPWPSYVRQEANKTFH